MTSGIELLLRHNAWANLVLVDACAQLTAEQLSTSAEGVYGTVPDTLHHIVGNEAWYLTLYGVQTEGMPVRGERFAGFEPLRALAERTGPALIEQARALDPELRLRGEMNGRAYDMPAAVPLAQAVNHGTDHRSQVASTLTSLGIAPPPLDIWTFAETTGTLWA